MKKYLSILILFLAIVATPAYATNGNQSSLQSLIQQIQALIQKIEQLVLQQQGTSPGNNPLVSPNSLSTDNSLTVNKIMNSNGFVNGKKQVDIHSSENLSDAKLVDINGDGKNEAITLHTGCGASCGVSVWVSRSVEGSVQSLELPQSLVAGAAQKVDSVIARDGQVELIETDFGGTKLLVYQISVSRGDLVAKIVKSKIPVELAWATYYNSVNNLSFDYPKSLVSNCATLQGEPTIEINREGTNKIDAAGCFVSGEGRPKNENLSLGERNFCLSKTSDVGAGQLYYDYRYTTFRGGQYYTLRFIVHTSNGCGALQDSQEVGAPNNQNYRLCLACQANFENISLPLLHQAVSSLKFGK